jgi:para-aminobenzoate synthetase / 4-amino-4-deoxychorismate lyase
MNLIVLESLRSSGQETSNYYLSSPEKILQCREPAEVLPLLKEVEQAVADGYFAAGFLTYEAGYAFLPNLPSPGKTHLPLGWFALFRDVEAVRKAELPADFGGFEEARVENLSLNLEPQSYSDALAKIRLFIAQGFTYQVNFTMRYRGAFEGSPRSLYRKLRNQQRVSYAAYIESEDWAILSLSPELFFRQIGSQLVTRPMKGTAPRGRTLAEDEEIAHNLTGSAKEMSENLMIVDLLRNDLGKVCVPGTIEVTNPMQVERYETLLQMTSTIGGRLGDTIKLSDIFRATFPSGSVTGAPKLKTMQIIHELEQQPRGIYTGAIGFVNGDEAVFNVAIRTAIVDRRQKKIEMGVGSGILYEADANYEYAECRLKGKFLTETPPEFRLIETILWEPERGFRNLEMHLERLFSSAEYFVFAFNKEEIRGSFKEWHQQVSKEFTRPQRVRFLLDADGAAEFQSSNLEPLPEGLEVRLSERRTNSADRFLYHKTTNRVLYDSELNKARSEGFFDVLFRNEQDEITEGAISNLFVRLGNVCYTPPVSSGLLPGIFRRYLLESSNELYQEKVLRQEDLHDADGIFVCNSIRGLIPVKITRE